MNRFLGFFIAISIITLLVSSCTTVNTPPAAKSIPWKSRAPTLARIHNWQLNGKIALQTAQDSGSAIVSWGQHQNQFNMSLSGPLGINGLQLKGQPGRITLLTANGKQYEASSPEELLSQQWGWHLPISYLNYWIRGLPVPGITKNVVWDRYQRIYQLKQANFDIQFIDYMTVTDAQGVVDLPNRILITSPLIKIKIIIYHWKLG